MKASNRSRSLHSLYYKQTHQSTSVMGIFLVGYLVSPTTAPSHQRHRARLPRSLARLSRRLCASLRGPPGRRRTPSRRQTRELPAATPEQRCVVVRWNLTKRWQSRVRRSVLALEMARSRLLSLELVAAERATRQRRELPTPRVRGDA